MKLEERLKEKFLKPNNNNIFKYIYFLFQRIKKEKYSKNSYSGGGIDLIVDYYFKNQNIERTIQSDIYKYMISKNYSLINWLHSDLVFINKKFQD